DRPDQKTYLQPKHKNFERLGLQQLALPVRAQPQVSRQLAVGLEQHVAERRQPERRGGKPPKPEDATDDHRREGHTQAVTQLVEVLDERHRSVGVVPTAASATVLVEWV